MWCFGLIASLVALRIGPVASHLPRKPLILPQKDLLYEWLRRAGGCLRRIGGSRKRVYEEKPLDIRGFVRINAVYKRSCRLPYATNCACFSVAAS